MNKIKLTQFQVPKGSTIASARRCLPMTAYVGRNLTDRNFGNYLPEGLVAGGFLPMNENFESGEGIKAARKIAEETGRDFRLGTTLEALLFLKQNRSRCPKRFLVLGTVGNGKVLIWSSDCAGFHLLPWEGRWGKVWQIFIVEDL